MALLVLLSGTTFAASADAFDIVGIRLGMTPEQTLTALRAHRVKESTIDVSRQVFQYSDGLKHDYKTPDFVYMVVAAKDDIVDGKRRTDTFNLFFSPPPQGGRLVAISRVIANRIDPTTNGQFLDALVAKYGEPTERQAGLYRWLFGDGTKACRDYNLPDAKKGILRDVYIGFPDRFRNAQVKSLNECANQLQYSVGSMADQPATRVTAYMTDVQSWVKAEHATNEWLSSLAAEAAAKRKAQGQGPQL